MDIRYSLEKNTDSKLNYCHVFFIKVKKNLRQPDCKLSKMLLMNLTEEEDLTGVSLLIDTGFVALCCYLLRLNKLVQ